MTKESRNLNFEPDMISSLLMRQDTAINLALWDFNSGYCFVYFGKQVFQMISVTWKYINTKIYNCYERDKFWI